MPRKSADSPEQKDDQTTLALCALALDLAEQEDSAELSDELRAKDAEFHKLVRKLLNQQKDEVLYGAIEQAKFEDVGAYQFLRAAVEEAAATVLLRRDNAPVLEVNAFAIPLFVHSDGGLRADDDFQDQDAFEALVASLQTAQLESAKAKVVLIRHAYDLKEIDSIAYGHLHAMVREAAASMTDKKLLPTPALEGSFSGWSETAFAAGDAAVELRFLLGFALKREDDPFYHVPDDEAAADAYFAERMERYQAWTVQAAPLLARCLGQQRALELNFLYQDLFYGAKEQGMAEYATLQMMAELTQAAQAHGGQAQALSAIVGPADTGGDIVLRVQLYADGHAAPLASCDKALDLAADLELEVADVRDALSTIGVERLSVALRFDAKGQPLEVRALAQ
ncbi:DUF2863 family protein [Rugamonas sp.]|uniref:DUF2863 family protein n=1 Tax=Rugamonas sp. TaxID=1926287 RepID=UPI00345C533B